MQGNKHNYFSLSITIKPEYRELEFIQEIEQRCEEIMTGMTVGEEWYSFKTKEQDVVMFVFKSESRKRVTQLIKLISRKSQTGIEKIVPQAVNRSKFYNTIKRLEKESDWVEIRAPEAFDDYMAEDLKVFENGKDSFLHWQRDIYELLFDEDENIRKADHRKIIHVLDGKGQKGKSSFIKYLCYKQPNEIAKFGYGTAGQLRSAVVKSGRREAYIIDLPRTKGASDKIEDLLTVIEEVKNGHVMTPFRGSLGVLMMEPPFILVFSNEKLPYGSLSADRWVCYEIVGEGDPTLVDITPVLNKPSKTLSAIKKSIKK